MHAGERYRSGIATCKRLLSSGGPSRLAAGREIHMNGVRLRLTEAVPPGGSVGDIFYDEVALLVPCHALRKRKKKLKQRLSNHQSPQIFHGGIGDDYDIRETRSKNIFSATAGRTTQSTWWK